MNKSIYKLTTLLILILAVISQLKTDIHAEAYRRNYSEIKFSEYSSITELYIGPDIDFDFGPNDEQPFHNMLHLAVITVDESNPNLSSYKGCLYNKDKTKLICFPQGLAGTEIPTTCVEIAPGALYGKSLNMHRKVKAIITRNNGGEWPGYSRYVSNPKDV